MAWLSPMKKEVLIQIFETWSIKRIPSIINTAFFNRPGTNGILFEVGLDLSGSRNDNNLFPFRLNA